MTESENKYSDIINLPHPISKRHSRMSIDMRSAQFSPFAALTGHKEAIRETARLTDQRIEIDEEKKLDLDMKLQDIVSHLEEFPMVSFTYFVSDRRKEGGTYMTETVHVKKLDISNQMIKTIECKNIPISEIIEIMIH